MTPYCACGDTYGDMQITSVRVVGAPDYLSDYKEHPELLGFLGALILGKVAATDAKNLVTKADYNDHGPNAIHTKAP
jgi:actin-related protein